MIKAYTNILSDKVISKLNELSIDYKRLDKTKQNEIAFTSHNGNRREFEVKFMANGIFRIGTRYLGYRSVMARHGLAIDERCDPDGKRTTYRVSFNDTKHVNDFILTMLKEGYSDNPQVKLFY